MALEQLRQYLRQEFPQVSFEVESAGDMQAVIRQRIDPMLLRPGNTVSGPALMLLVDCAFYVALLAVDGSATSAVTSNLNINFLNKPPGNRDIVARCRLFKVGSRLATGEVTLYSDGVDEPVAHATLSYSLPN